MDAGLSWVTLAFVKLAKLAAVLAGVVKCAQVADRQAGQGGAGRGL
jgi:hypothetical protein